jgi:hypothetical protein
MHTSLAVILGGPAGILGAKIGNAIVSDERQSKMRGTFLAGAAFEQAAKDISCKDGEPEATIELDIVRFQPVLDVGLADSKRGLTVGMEWLAAIAGENGADTRSTYVCTYDLGNSKLFTSAEEKDVLREMVEHALAHWAERVNVTRNEGGKATFPEFTQGDFNLEHAKCSYRVFAPNNSDSPATKTETNEHKEPGPGTILSLVVEPARLYATE